MSTEQRPGDQPDEGVGAEAAGAKKAVAKKVAAKAAGAKKVAAKAAGAKKVAAKAAGASRTEAAGKSAGGSIDMIWINGENFRTAKQARLLWGPFAEALPNLRSYDPEVRKRDFGTAIEGYEAPWQKAQFVFAYDAARTPAPRIPLGQLRPIASE